MPNGSQVLVEVRQDFHVSGLYAAITAGNGRIGRCRHFSSRREQRPGDPALQQPQIIGVEANGDGPLRPQALQRLADDGFKRIFPGFDLLAYQPTGDGQRQLDGRFLHIRYQLLLPGVQLLDGPRDAAQDPLRCLPLRLAVRVTLGLQLFGRERRLRQGRTGGERNHIPQGPRQWQRELVKQSSLWFFRASSRPYSFIISSPAASSR